MLTRIVPIASGPMVIPKWPYPPMTLPLPDGRRRAGRLRPLLIGAALAIALAGPASSALADGEYSGVKPVTFEPASSAPFTEVTGIGFDCGAGFNQNDLFGLELTDVPVPPTRDEGVSIILRNISKDSAGRISATFEIPDLAAGRYYVYYLCAKQRETRIFLAQPQGGLFTVELLRPHPTAPPSAAPAISRLGPASGALLIIVLIALASSLILRRGGRAAGRRKM